MLPKVSVILSVYNDENYISDAIESILNQSYRDFELICCDDKSTDGSLEVLRLYEKSYTPVIRVIENSENRGQAFARNRCIEVASGSYIAIMDSDDKCDLERLRKQVAFLDHYPEISFVGTGMTFFDDSGTWATRLVKPFPMKKDYVPNAPFCLASCMFRRDVLEAVGGYNEKLINRRGEDYELVVSLIEKGYRGASICEPLYFCREDSEVYKKRKLNDRLIEAMRITDAVKRLKLPYRYYLYVIRPIILALLPGKLYMMIHRASLKKQRIY